MNVPRFMFVLDYVQKDRFLEVHLLCRLNWPKYSEAMRGKALKFLGKLIPLLKLSLPVSSKLLVYKAYLLPLMTYASPAWAFITKYNLLYMERQKKV